MSTLTIRFPDDKHERLKALAKSNAISVNKLMDELAAIALANDDVRARQPPTSLGIARQTGSRKLTSARWQKARPR